MTVYRLADQSSLQAGLWPAFLFLLHMSCLVIHQTYLFSSYSFYVFVIFAN